MVAGKISPSRSSATPAASSSCRARSRPR
jgi:hypothetical protein